MAAVLLKVVLPPSHQPTHALCNPNIVTQHACGLRNTVSPDV